MDEEELRRKLESLQGVERLQYIIRLFLENELVLVYLEEELLNKRRFFSVVEQKIYLDKLNNSLPEKAIIIVDTQEQFYRARYISRDFERMNFPEYGEFIPYLEECFNKLKDKIPHIISKASYKLQKEIFRGMPKEESGAPPAGLVKEGRLNPVNIPFLYTATEMETAIQEIRPQIGQTVSVAKLQAVKPLKVLDLTTPAEGSASYFGYHPKTFFEVVSEAFRRPNHDDPKKYLITQYLAEYIRIQLNFDGICFWSSLRKGGKNVVFFDTEACVPVASDLITVENIEFKLKSFYGE